MTVYSGQGRERLIQAVAANSDANGLIAFRLGPCPLGFVWQGSVTITSAPSGALFNASVGTPWGQWAGSTNFGPVQLWGNETLTVAGIGLQKSTQYSMLFFGVAMPEWMADPLPPVAPLSTVSVETSTLLVNAATATNAGFTDVTVPSLTRRLTVVVASGAFATTRVSVVGNTTGAAYGFSDVVGPGTAYFAIEPTIDPAYRISVSGTGGINYWITANSTNPLIVTDDSHPLDIAQPVTVNQQNGTIFDVGGSPIGTVDHYLSVTGGGGGATFTVVAAPGVGNSLYLQSCSVLNAAGAVATFLMQDTGGTVFDSFGLATAPPDNNEQHIFPGCLRISPNLGISCIASGLCRVSITYASGTSI